MAAGGPSSEITKYGYVEIKSKHLKSFRKRWLVLYGATRSSPARLVKYTNEKEFQQDPKGRHEYFFTEVISAERIPGKDKGVRVRLSTENCKEISFVCDSEVGADDWVASIQKEVGGNRDTFETILIHSTHANIQGKVTLRVGEGHVVVIQDGQTRLRIPLTTIRKYQMDEDSVFWIETGRKSPIGEGFLHFRSDLAYSILSRLDDEARQEVRRKDSTSSAQSSYEDHPGPATHPTNASYIPVQPMPNRVEGTRRLSDTRSHYPNSSDPRREEYPRIPTAHSMPRLPAGENYQQSTGWGQDRGYRNELQDRGYSRGRLGQDRLRQNTGLVAPEPFSFPRETVTRQPYMQMGNPVSRTTLNATSEEGTPYTDMKNADRNTDQRDYLTPLHIRADARFRTENRNS